MNVLEEAVPDFGGAALVLWSGWFGDDPGARDPRAWLAGGYERLVSRLNAARERLEMTGGRWLLRPHARHVLNDPQRCARFCDEFVGTRFGMALDPVSLLEVSMLAHAEDHLTRSMQRLGARAECVVVPEVAVGAVGVGDEARVVCCAGGPGPEVAPGVIRGLVEQLVPGARVVTVPGWG